MARNAGPSRLDIDVVIAVHSTQRPIVRAVASCYDGLAKQALRVTIVCHNMPSDEIRATVTAAGYDSVRFVELNDGINSPAGPKNHGMALADARYVGLLDSDDFYEPGALAHWHTVLTENDADAVVAPVKHLSGELIRTPRARIGRTHNLHGVKDRLAYATAPRGLWRTDFLRSIGYQYTEGLRTGEDLAPGLKLYFSGARTEFPLAGPKYVLGDDAEDRVTAESLPLKQDFEAISRLDQAWLEQLSDSARQSIAIKLARVNLLGAVLRRGSSWPWQEEDLCALEDLARQLARLHPNYERPLSISESQLLAATSQAASNPGAFRSAIESYRAATPAERLLTRDIWSTVHPESTARHLARLLAAGWRPATTGN